MFCRFCRPAGWLAAPKVTVESDPTRIQGMVKKAFDKYPPEKK